MLISLAYDFHITLLVFLVQDERLIVSIDILCIGMKNKPNPVINGGILMNIFKK